MTDKTPINTILGTLYNSANDYWVPHHIEMDRYSQSLLMKEGPVDWHQNDRTMLWHNIPIHSVLAVEEPLPAIEDVSITDEPRLLPRCITMVFEGKYTGRKYYADWSGNPPVYAKELPK